MQNATLVDQLTYELLPYVAPAVVLSGLLMAVGSVGNGLVLYFYLRFKSLSSHYYILTLACYDMAVCLPIIPFDMYLALHYYNNDNVLLCKSFRFVENTVVCGSVFTLVLIAQDRYAKIYHPYFHISRYRAKKLCLLTGILSFALNLPFSFLVFGISRPQTRIPELRGHRCYEEVEPDFSASVKAYKVFVAAIFVAVLASLTFFYSWVWYYFKHRRSSSVGHTLSSPATSRVQEKLTGYRKISNTSRDTVGIAPESPPPTARRTPGGNAGLTKTLPEQQPPPPVCGAVNEFLRCPSTASSLSPPAKRLSALPDSSSQKGVKWSPLSAITMLRHHSGSERHATASVIVATALFFFCYVFVVVVGMLDDGDDRTYRPVWIANKEFLFRVAFVQNAANPFVYAFFQPNFRSYAKRQTRKLLKRLTFRRSVSRPAGGIKATAPMA